MAENCWYTGVCRLLTPPGAHAITEPVQPGQTLGSCGLLTSTVASRRVQTMLTSYFPIFIFIVIAAAFAAFTIVFARLVSAQKPNAIKLEPYEYGIEAAGDARDRDRESTRLNSTHS